MKKFINMRNLIFIIIIVILILIINAKYFFIKNNNIFFFIYGITVTVVTAFLFLIAAFYKDPSIEIINKNINKGKKKPLISCILAVFNEEKIIDKCIKSLIDSDYKNKEIIIVNDASTDNTIKVLKQFEQYENIKIINLKKNVGKKKAICRGIEIAKGEIYVFTDSDSIVNSDAIGRIIEIFIANDDVGAVSGHSRALNSNKNFLTKVQDSWYDGQFTIKKAFESFFGAVTCISGPLAVFRKEAIFNFMPAWENDTFLKKEFKFSTDRTLTGFVLGSKYLAKKIKKKYADSWFVKSVNYEPRDWKLFYCKSAKVYTEVPDTFNKFIRQQVRWKKSFIRNIFFTGLFYWKKPFFPALRYYLSALFIIFAPFIVFRQMVYLPLNGDLLSFIFYLAGILFIGSLYSIVYKIENPNSTIWKYRPVMSIFATLILSWLIFYSLITITKSIWHRG